MKRRQPIERLFERLNTQFFRGRLPRYQVRIVARFPDEIDGQYGYCDQDRLTIYLRQGLDVESQRRVLLHEMCHHGCPGHGQRFQLKLQRLADNGESWAVQEAAEYCAPSRRLPLTTIIRQDIDQIIDDLPNASWPHVQRLLARQHGAARLKRAAPWAKSVW